MDWISQIPTEAWGAMGTVLVSLASALGLLIREAVKRREAELKLVTERARIELEEREADAANFTTVVQLLSKTLTKFEETNNRFVERLDSLVKSSQVNANAVRTLAESNQVMLELTKRSSEDAGREAVRVISTTRTAHAETRAYVKEQTDPIAVAIEQLRAEIPAASRQALEVAAHDFLQKVYKLRGEAVPTEPPTTGEPVTDPSAAHKQDGDGMATASIPKPAKFPKKDGESSAGQEDKPDDSKGHSGSSQ